MRISFLAVISAALTLVGCTTLPKSVDRPNPIGVEEIFRSVACEFVAAATANPTLKDWGATADLTISSTDDAIIMPSLEWNGTINNAKVSVKPSGKGETIVQSDVEVLHDYIPVGDAAFKECPEGTRPGVSGLGLDAELGYQMSLVGASSPDHVKKMKIDRTFSVYRAVGGGLTFTVYGVSVKFDGSQASRLDKNFISIVLQPRAGRSTNVLRDTLRQQIIDNDQERTLTNVLRDAVEQPTE